MQTLTTADRVRIPEEVIFQEVGEETVILNLATKLYYGLDQVGTRVWELLEEKGTLQAVFESMREEYEIAPDDLERDILRLVEELHAKGLVEIETS